MNKNSTSGQLILAAYAGDLHKVKELLNQHTPPDAQDAGGFTALAWASAKGHIEVVKALLEHGADSTIRDARGRTATQVAAFSQHHDVVRLLRHKSRIVEPTNHNSFSTQREFVLPPLELLNAATETPLQQSQKRLVTIRECLATNEFMNAPSRLTFALGMNQQGYYLYADLGRLPHLLIGGTTNSGKSIFLHSLITSILYRATPREVNFIMIDPQRVELSLYNGIPHLLSPVAVNLKQASSILHSAMQEVESRADKFYQAGTRGLQEYNKKSTPDERLPYIVIVIDEIADLMRLQGAEVGTLICKLAQSARAAGVHLVIATQRPSVDIITGSIKASMPSRVAFAMPAQVDSFTILDELGAEQLTGRGDMLFMPIDAAKPVRVQGCYVGERETEGLVKYLYDQEEPKYPMVSYQGIDTVDHEDIEDDADELFEPCVRWLVLQGQCSTSSLQRKFKIGYTRAARLVEIMEARGIVGSQDGVKPREILLRPENIDAFFAGHQDSQQFQTGRQDHLLPPPYRPEEPDVETLDRNTAKHIEPVEQLELPTKRLTKLIGLHTVKQDVVQLVNFLRFQQVRKQKGMTVPEQSLHMVFTGNPGTGKTTIARLIAQIYQSLGVLSKGHFVETDRSGLVGGYLGQTALKTRDVVESAIGGVLFIDEAYSLTDDEHGRDMYGQEAVATLLKLMEDHRNDLVVIVAGYTEPMQKFIRSNPGLQSRFNKFLHFDDYSPTELVEIFGSFAKQSDYKLSAATELKLGNVFTGLYRSRDETFGNARLARNLFEKAINNHASRMVAAGTMDEESLVTLQPEDISV